MLIKQRSNDSQTRCAHPWLGRVILAAGFAATALCFVRAMPATPVVAQATPWHDSRHIADAGTDQDSRHADYSLGYVTKNIEDIRVGDRVLADNPDVDSPSETNVNPATWRKLILRAEERWEDGTIDDINVETLQPLEWIERHGVRVGTSIQLPLDLIEMGLPENLRATVIAIERCPPPSARAGRVVLTTVNHLNKEVLELTLRSAEGLEEIVRPTASHRFYRASEFAWVLGNDLRRGDTLRGLNGPVTVLSRKQFVGTHRVYNLTVEGEHVYNVASFGILVHNTCPPFPPKPTEPPAPGWEWRGTGPPESGKGSWYKPDTAESLHPDLNHPPPIGPHYDYTAPDGSQWRLFPDGRVEPK